MHRRKPSKGKKKGHKPSNTEPVTRAMARRMIEEKIWKAQCLPGDRLKQEALAFEFNASQGTVREAILELGVTGIVEYKEGQGFSVVDRETIIRAIRNGYELRIVLESFAVERAASDAYPEDLARLRELAENIRNLSNHGTLDEMAVLERHWHLSLVRLAGNQLLNDLLNTHWFLGKTIRTNRQATPDQADHTFNFHNDILKAIENRDGSLAARIVKQHITEGLHAFDRHVALQGALHFVPAELPKAPVVAPVDPKRSDHRLSRRTVSKKLGNRKHAAEA